MSDLGEIECKRSVHNTVEYFFECRKSRHNKGRTFRRGVKKTIFTRYRKK